MKKTTLSSFIVVALVIMTYSVAFSKEAEKKDVNLRGIFNNIFTIDFWSSDVWADFEEGSAYSVVANIHADSEAPTSFSGCIGYDLVGNGMGMGPLLGGYFTTTDEDQESSSGVVAGFFLKKEGLNLKGVYGTSNYLELLFGYEITLNTKWSIYSQIGYVTSSVSASSSLMYDAGDGLSFGVGVVAYEGGLSPVFRVRVTL